MKIRTIDVSYSQIAVFQSALQQPFNDWTDRHVAQGFAWRLGSVAFATLEPAGPMDLDVVVRTTPSIDTSAAARIIAVPFTVDDTGDIEVASIADREALSLPPGEYRLTFEHGLKKDGAMWCRLSFDSAAIAVTAEVLRADAALAPSLALAMDAVPAE